MFHSFYLEHHDVFVSLSLSQSHQSPNFYCQIKSNEMHGAWTTDASCFLKLVEEGHTNHLKGRILLTHMAWSRKLPSNLLMAGAHANSCHRNIADVNIYLSTLNLFFHLPINLDTRIHIPLQISLTLVFIFSHWTDTFGGLSLSHRQSFLSHMARLRCPTQTSKSKGQTHGHQ